MASTRDVIAPPIFAEDASTTIPPTPIAGVSYRDPVAGPASSPGGWPYAEIVNSAEFNQLAFQWSSLISILDKKGVLGWSNLVDYTEDSIAFGSNGSVYKWLQESGPGTVAGVRDPVSEPAYWAVQVNGGLPTDVAGGTANALTANFTPDLSLDNGTTVLVRANAANTTTTPTLSVDGAAAKTITKQGSTALAAGDIKGAGHWLILSLDTSLNKWVLGNPATSGDVSGPASAVDNQVVLFNGATGKLVKAGNLVNTYAPLASPIFTGTPTAPTAAAATNNTQLATTAFVKTAAPKAAQCSAWVNFNGTGVVAINDAFNVTSITDNGTGDYTINFAAGTFANANYTVSSGWSTDAGDEGFYVRSASSGGAPNTKTTAAVRMVMRRSSVYVDGTDLSATFFGGN